MYAFAVLNNNLLSLFKVNPSLPLYVNRKSEALSDPTPKVIIDPEPDASYKCKSFHSPDPSVPRLFTPLRSDVISALNAAPFKDIAPATDISPCTDTVFAVS